MKKALYGSLPNTGTTALAAAPLPDASSPLPRGGPPPEPPAPPPPPPGGGGGASMGRAPLSASRGRTDPLRLPGAADKWGTGREVARVQAAPPRGHLC